MKEQLHTIPLGDAFLSGDECPFCFLERKAEQSALRYVAGPGASYMEPDVRAVTDRAGFCTVHMKKLYDYGNTLGSALMLQTHYADLLTELQAEIENFTPPPRKGLLRKKPPQKQDSYWRTLRKRMESCYICEKIEYNMDRYYRTFFTLLKEPEFRERVEQSKGFCLRHFSRVLELAETELPANQQEWFYPTVFSLVETNLLRVKEDLDWLIAKYDYRNAGADWKNARDALPRAMQKLRGLYPADPPYKEK